MKEQPEALRLANDLEIDYHGDVVTHETAAELRRLHQFAEDQIGRATAAEAALQMTKTTHALKIAAVEAQRDALLEVARAVDAHYSASLDYKPAYVALARAAIKAVEEEA